MTRRSRPLNTQATLRRFLIVGSLALALAGCVTKNYGDEAFHLGMASHGKDVMWVPTKADLVYEMLSAAKVQPNDIVYDLGSGDGIIPIEAAKRFGVRAVGIEYNPDLVALSIRNAKRAGVENLVNLKRGDIFVEDFSGATILTLYLGENLNVKLKPRIFQMKAGARVVSNTFRMGSWIPDETIRTSAGETAYLWIVPAAIEGEWAVEGLPGAEASRLKIRQKKQFFDGSIEAPGRKRIDFEGGRIIGNTLSFEFKDQSGARHVFSGRVEGPRLSGLLNDDPRRVVDGRRR
jgi:precorrin-6B methylase 2